jgi:hypothetical protein
MAQDQLSTMRLRRETQTSPPEGQLLTTACTRMRNRWTSDTRCSSGRGWWVLTRGVRPGRLQARGSTHGDFPIRRLSRNASHRVQRYPLVDHTCRLGAGGSLAHRAGGPQLAASPRRRRVGPDVRQRNRLGASERNDVLDHTRPAGPRATAQPARRTASQQLRRHLALLLPPGPPARPRRPARLVVSVSGNVARTIASGVTQPRLSGDS